MWMTVQRTADPIIDTQFGFVPGVQAMDITESDRNLLRKARGWGHPLYIASLGVGEAFDQFEAYAAQRALRDHAAPVWAIAAVLRELMG